MLEIGQADETPFPDKETTEAIIGAAFEVSNQLGYGFLELQAELLRRGATAEIEKRIQVQYKGVVVGDCDADLIVDNCVAVEIKVSPQYDKRDEAQLLNELKATGLKVGVLLNFGRTKVEFRRLVF
jgi:GxxExxY protein